MSVYVPMPSGPTTTEAIFDQGPEGLSARCKLYVRPGMPTKLTTKPPAVCDGASMFADDELPL